MSSEKREEQPKLAREWDEKLPLIMRFRDGRIDSVELREGIGDDLYREACRAAAMILQAVGEGRLAFEAGEGDYRV